MGAVTARWELDAAGITDPDLRAAYARCRGVNAAHGKTYYLSALLLPPAKRPYVHALYGLARTADDIVDDLSPALCPAQRADRFAAWSAGFLDDLQCGTSSDPVRRAVIDTIDRWRIPADHFADFLDAMRADLTVTEYDTFDDLARYMWGSAAVIGLQMLPILGRADARTPWDALAPHAADLGMAFQLTNFIRDVREDLARGRVYLPQETLRRFGVDRARLLRAASAGRTDAPIRDVLAHEIERARALYRRAAAGVELVHPTSRDCLRTSITLYREILDRIERCGYDVFGRRATVPPTRRTAVAARGLLSAWSTRRGGARRSIDSPGGPATPRSTVSGRPGRSRRPDLRPVPETPAGR